jgi:hypothetical protein
MYALTQIERDDESPGAVHIAQTIWEGSQPIESLFPGAAGHWIAENMITQMGRIKKAAAAYPFALSYDASIIIQGENSSPDWDLKLEDLVDDVLPLEAAALGVAAPPPTLFLQTNTDGDFPTPSTNVLQMVAVARRRSSPTLSLVGPMYQYPLDGGNIHLTSLGRLMMGATVAHVHDHVVRQGLAWHPLWPVAGGVTRTGGVIRIPMELPPGTTELVFDDDWISGITDRGFAFRQTGGNSPVIQSVAIDGTEIVVTLDVEPTGTDKVIAIAMANDSGRAGWATGGCTIYAPGRACPYHRMGHPTPERIRHYPVRCEEAVP